ncbi:MAG: bifunctional folylpolyglutamate synthase/dihydrofolate synthase [Prevotellaceae bacterium]|jgi:dihydrofolate synthase/folylpolyglutamate synthase|nr:bifunctional folylpolyglutamate synthase/dihydrofolate synthase [Prevotellaceae bacterium]
MARFTIYEDAAACLFERLPMYQSIGKAAYKAGLATPEALDKYFGHPHRKYRCIHVAGTNGKGSVSHMLAAALQAAGYRVGLYTSPHLKDFRERIKVNGAPIFPAAVLDFVNAHYPWIEKNRASFFEMTTALAFDYFARREVDIAVVETGMGGRLDATNIIRPALSVITNIGLDHTEHLGGTLEAIAREKAGIIKRRTPAVIGEALPETEHVFRETAAKQKAPLLFAKDCVHVTPDGVYDRLQHFIVQYAGAPLAALRVAVDLLGEYQRYNARTALAALEVLRSLPRPVAVSTRSILDGLEQAARLTGLRGRWEILESNPTVICDTGHNAHGLQHSLKQLADMPHNRLHIVFGVVADKDLSAILPLLPRDACYYFTQAALPRALDAAELAAQCHAAGLSGETVPNVREALSMAKNRAAPGDVIFVGGSNFVVAEVI